MKAITLAMLACAAGILLLAVRDARADAQFQQSNRIWRGEDNCAKAAFKQFPDYTPQGNRDRERAYQACISGAQLPPREQLQQQSQEAKQPPSPQGDTQR